MRSAPKASFSRTTSLIRRRDPSLGNGRPAQGPTGRVASCWFDSIVRDPDGFSSGLLIDLVERHLECDPGQHGALHPRRVARDPCEGRGVSHDLFVRLYRAS